MPHRPTGLPFVPLAALLLQPAALTAQHYVELNPVTRDLLGGAFDGQRQVPILVTHDAGIGVDVAELRRSWSRREGEGKLPLQAPVLWTDPVRQRVLAFGGRLTPTSASGFEWDGVRWRPLPGNFPGAFWFGCAPAFDSVRQEALFLAIFAGILFVIAIVFSFVCSD